MEQSPRSVLAMFSSFFFPTKNKHRVTRVIEVKQRFNQWGKVQDHEQQSHLLQKAVSLYLVDVLDLKSKNAQYELLEKTKKTRITKSLLNSTGSESGCSMTGSESSDNSDNDNDNNDDQYCSEMDRLSVEMLPPLNEQIEIELGVFFTHETVTSENTGEKVIIKKSTVSFRFESSLPDASKRIDAIIDRAFRNYQAIERRKHVKDKSRYFYVHLDTATSIAHENNDHANPVVYKRYVLGEEKTFENLFFEEKEQVLQLLDNFKTRSGKFAIKGFPYKLGLLLHGPPGTGKTSLIKAIAQYTKRHVVAISLGKIKTNQQLRDTLFDMKFAVQELDLPIDMGFEDVVFVMEDIDCASSIVKARANNMENADVDATNTDTSATSSVAAKNSPQVHDDMSVSKMIKTCVENEKKDKMHNDQLNLSGLLNVLDGVIDCPGRIVIMTTNHPEKLDPALVRPGRVNKKLLLGYMGPKQVQQMIEYYCNSALSLEQRGRLSVIFGKKKSQFTPADVEELCVEFDDIDSILGRLDES